MSRLNHGPIVLMRRPSALVSRGDAALPLAPTPREMDAFVGLLFGGAPISSPAPRAAEPGIQVKGIASPDVYETEDQIVFVLPLPGVDAADLQVEATAETLTLRGERKPFYQNEKAKQHRQSVWSANPGKFEVAYTLPVAIDADKITANYRNGVLEVILPKPEVVKPKAIKVDVQNN